MFRRIQHIHLIGIGGSGMSGIAEVLANLNFRVSGSDLKRSDVTQRLEKKFGIKVSEGHAAANVHGAQVVVKSTAVREDNPEIVEARRLSITVIPRAEMLAELMRLKLQTIAVAGSHGKTTTTSMIAQVLAAAELDPTAVIGGIVGAFGSNARLGKSDLMVVEADESDRSFLMLTPTYAVVTNIDREHMDYYKDMDDVRECFVNFVNRVPFYGAAVVCLDNENVQAVIPRVMRRRIAYGLSAQADITARHIRHEGFGSTFTVAQHGETIGEVTLKVPGLHNVYNSLAAIAIASEFDVPFDVTAKSLSEFAGVHRRFQLIGEAKEIKIYDDYGHHPTEVRATLQAAKDGAAGRRILVLFQPHRYTRTKDLLDEFARSFNNADAILVSDIYAASEDPIEGVTAEVLTEAVTRYGHKNARYIGSIDNAVAALLAEAKAGDIVITLGAGSVARIGEQFLEALNAEKLKR
ncbi:MAG: UDP-N-acetylmuramate--L-alanine ligase [Pyrinomonadaceae bacterium]